VSGAMDGEANETKRICRHPAIRISHYNLKSKTGVSNINVMKLLGSN
jgi:hypothetical protein